MTNRHFPFPQIILAAALSVGGTAAPAAAQSAAANSPRTSQGHREKQAAATKQASAKEAANLSGGGLLEDLRDFVATPAAPGYEQPLAEKIRARLARYSPRTDSAGNVLVTMGTGAPHRVIAAPMDEPALVVSGITEDGYLRVQRLPQNFPQGTYNQLLEAQPVLIGAPDGKWINGVFAGLSVHLQPGRERPDAPPSLDDLYVDAGAGNPAEARSAGADVLSPIVPDRELLGLAGGKLAGQAVGDRFGAAALVELARHVDAAKLKGTLTLAFLAQQWTGSRGLARMLEEEKPDELVYCGRLMGERAPASGLWRRPTREPGSGVLLGLTGASDSLGGFAAEMNQLAGERHIPLAIDFSLPIIGASYISHAELPARTIHMGIATAWPETPAEMVDARDLLHLAELLEAYATGETSGKAEEAPLALAAAPQAPPPHIAGKPATTDALRALVESYGVSGNEGAVREMVKRLLPPWARPETDAAGNLVLHFGRSGAARAEDARLLFVAHMDEIGFVVTSIGEDGRLNVEWRGGGLISFFAGHPVMLHTASGVLPGVMELPDGWDKPGFAWPRGNNLHLRVDVGARTREEAEKLGIAAGNWMTIPKRYRALADHRANGRSFDDRVGCTALIAAAWALGPRVAGRDVTFVWSTGEEEGLVGAAATADRLAKEGQTPQIVFAIDTFVSSDSPLESKRFADAPVGAGFVVRAVDNSNIVPRKLTERVVALARANQIPVQYGVTGGGNDGAVFTRYGATDVALGWPLRYSHSPAEVIDTRDLDALERIVAVLAGSW